MAKISIFTNYFPPEVGAASFRLLDMAKGLKTSGIDIEVYTAMPNYPKGKIFENYRRKIFLKETIDGIEVRRHWIFATHSDSKYARLLNMLSIGLSIFFSFFHILKKKPDIIIVQYPPFALPLISLFFAKISKAHFIINVSDIWPSAIVDLGVMKKGFMYKVLDRVETFLYNKASLIMGQSEEILHHIRGKTQIKTVLYRTGVNSELFNQKKIYETHGKQFKIIYAGVLGIAHGLNSLCQKMDFVALGVELHIYGEGFEKSKIESFLKKNPNKSIFLHNVVPYTEIPNILKKYDAALISQKTSVFGTVPSKMYEALSVGLPVLYNGTGEGAKIIENTKAGFSSNPEKYEELSSNISLLKKMPSIKRAQMGENGRNAVKKSFERKLFIDKLIYLLNTEFKK